jgi:transposase
MDGWSPARWAATSRRSYRKRGATGWSSVAGTGDFTLRGLVAELGERGLMVDYRSVWEFVHAEKLSHKKRR